MKKRALIFLICLSISSILTAQEETRQKEIGLVFYNLDSFGVTFKTGSETALWRFNTLYIDGRVSDITINNTDNRQSSFSFGLSAGREFRRSLDEDFLLRVGADLSFGYGQSELENYEFEIIDDVVYILAPSRKSVSYTPGINLVLGMNYVINDNLMIGAELLPSYTYLRSTERTKRPNLPERKYLHNGFYWGISNTSILLSVSYKFY